MDKWVLDQPSQLRHAAGGQQLPTANNIFKVTYAYFSFSEGTEKVRKIMNREGDLNESGVEFW